MTMKNSQLNAVPVLPKRKSPHLVRFPKKRPTRRSPKLIQPYRTPISHQKFPKTLKYLETQADRINRLSAELETAIFQFKEAAAQINREKPHRAKCPERICEYYPTSIPVVRQKSFGRWILSDRPIDLFRSEREANVLAKKLRRRSNQRRSKPF